MPLQTGMGFAMADQTTTVTDAALQDALLAERRKFWGTWTRAVTAAAIVIALLLIVLRVFVA
jgi:hypothetical protein